MTAAHSSGSECLAQRNKSRTGGKATKERRSPYRQRGAILCAAKLANGKTHYGVKLEATDATGKVHKRSSTGRVYSHCLVIHFAAHPPSKLWPRGISAFSHAEWAGSCALAERNASRWRKDPYVEAIEILEARQV